MEIPVEKILRIKDKFLSNEEKNKFFSELPIPDTRLPTLLWSCKESVFKWYGDGGVDFSEHIQLKGIHHSNETIDCFFSKNNSQLTIHYREFEYLMLAWVVS